MTQGFPVLVKLVTTHSLLPRSLGPNVVAIVLSPVPVVLVAFYKAPNCCISGLWKRKRIHARVPSAIFTCKSNQHFGVLPMSKVDAAKRPGIQRRVAAGIW